MGLPKLVQLRSKTDRDLWILAQRELDRGQALADVASGPLSPLYAQAQHIYETVRILLPTIAGLTREERRDLESKLKDLRAGLDRVPSEKPQRLMAGASVD